MGTERDRVRALMLRKEPVPAGDLVIARMIIDDALRHRRSSRVFLVVVIAFAAFTVVRALQTDRWDWFAVTILAFVLASASFRVRAERRAQRWARRYLAPSPDDRLPRSLG